MYPIFLILNLSFSFCAAAVISTPFMMTEPLVGESIPAIILSRVDFPQPDAPRSIYDFPLSNVMSR